MSTATGAIAASRKSVDLARESLRLAERRFAEGVGTSLEVLDANVNLLAAETGLQQSLYQLDSAYLTTHRYLGDIVQVAQTAQSAGGT
jgi:outer membrane protein TolC